jgi:hypothetical protein
MTIELEDLGNGAAKPARFAAKYRGARRENVGQDDLAGDLNRGSVGGGAGVEPTGVDLLASPGPEPPPHGLDALDGPSFPLTTEWSPGPSESLVEHPLLRGLLLELPPRGTAPGTEWLDRWFEAARSILELLYVQETGRPR